MERTWAGGSGVSNADRATAVRIAFGETADPACYVARPATEQVLDRLEKAARLAARPGALIASPGMGKSLLLRVLAERLADGLQVVHLSYGALTIEELGAWVLGILGEQPAATGAWDALRRFAARTGPLALLIDDASSLPVETARSLGHWAGNDDGMLRLVLAASDDARASRVLAALGVEIEETRLVAPMSPLELAEYMRERGRRAGLAEAECCALGGAAAARIHALSGGVPRRVHELALQWLEGESEAATEQGAPGSSLDWDISEEDLGLDLE